MKISTRSKMVYLAIAALAPLTVSALAPSDGCGMASISSGTYTMSHGGLTRTYRVHVPTGYDNNTPAPMVVYFHGWGGNEAELISNKQATKAANQRGYILLAARGIGSGPPDNNYNSWSFSGSTDGLDGDGVNPSAPGDTDAICDEAGTTDYSYDSCAATEANSCSWTQCQVDDVDFAVELVAETGANLCVDEDNVFAMGGSNGGMFSWELGQNPASAPTFRAIAPLIGLPHRGYLDGPGKSGDMPVIVITGTRDKTVPPGDWDDPSYSTTTDGDLYYYTGATAITQSWADAHQCDTSGDAVSFDDGYRTPDCRTYCSADPGWPRVLDCRARMGHTYSFNWSIKLAMDFFDAHSAP